MEKISNEPFVKALQSVIRFAVRVLAILMTGVILWAVGDVVWLIYQQLMAPPRFLLTMGDILATFGAFMAVLIAIEIFINIVVYLRDEVIHVKIVMATALVAIARKAIVLDYETTASQYVWATAGLILALSVGYWLIAFKGTERRELKTRDVQI